MLKTLSSVFLNCSLVVVSFSATAPVFAQSTPKSSPTNGYPPSFSTNYMKSCIKSGTSKGVKPDVIDKYCSCTLTQIQAKIPYEKMKSIASNMKKTGKSSPEIQQIFSSCKNQNMAK